MNMGNSNPLDGRVAIVTGASRGIGAAIAERLASAGATVVLAARSVDHAATELAGTVNEVAARIRARGHKAEPIACDVENAASRASLIAETVRRHGRIDILVNNAGRAAYIVTEEMPLETVHSQIEQYLVAPFDLSRLALPHMHRQGGGWILNIGSSTGKMPADPPADPHNSGGRATLYSALKAGLHRMTAAMAAEFHDANIAVNALAPVSAILTPGVDALGVITEANRNRLEPIEHIAEAALALVSDAPRSRTGLIAFSYQYLDAIGRPTRSLDGKTVAQAR